MGRILKERTFSALGLGIRMAEERIDSPTDWGFYEDHPIFIVHRRGRMTSLESEFSPGYSTLQRPRKGDVWTVPAECRYAARAVGSRVEYCEIHLPAGKSPAGLAPRAGINDPFLAQAVERLNELLGRSDDLSGLLRESIVETIGLHLQDRAGSMRDLPRDHDSAMFARLAEYLRDTVEARHTVKEMAQFTGLAPSTFLRRFKLYFGTTPYRWLLDERLARARQLLASSQLPVTAIALDTGFSSSSHFTERFSSEIGLTPTAFRRRERGARLAEPPLDPTPESP